MASINTGATLVPPVEVTVPNQPAFSVSQVTIGTAGTPVQGPALPIPANVALAIQADPAMASSRRLYIANSSANALDATKRITLSAGQTITLSVTDANLVWFNGSHNGVAALLLVEA